MNNAKGGETMNDILDHGIPMEVILKGRPYDAVLAEYMRIWKGAKEAATAPGKTQDQIFSDTMMCAAYRVYLLGVEDGMKEVAK